MRKFTLIIILLLLLLALPAKAQDGPVYPLLETGHVIPPNPYRQGDEGAIWPSHEQVMTEGQIEAFQSLTGISVPLETVTALANTKTIRCTTFCYETGYVWSYELIAWSAVAAYDDFAVISVFENAIFTDYYLIAVYDTFVRGRDHNPHPRGFYWVRIDEFREVFP
jgi:hypothetical protein